MSNWFNWDVIELPSEYLTGNRIYKEMWINLRDQAYMVIEGFSVPEGDYYKVTLFPRTAPMHATMKEFKLKQEAIDFAKRIMRES